VRPTARTRRLGQNFLTDSAAARRMVDAADPGPGETVLEIGPGRGAITRWIVERGCRVVVVEVDPRLAAALGPRFGSAIDVVERSILDVDLAAIAPPDGPGLVVLGNLPYSISKPVAMKVVTERASIARAVLTFQREVAERLVARAGTRAYGPLTVLAAETWHVETVFELPPRAFRPRPAVASTVTRWTRRDRTHVDEAALRACLAVAFAHRRRTLRNNLRAALGSAERADEVLGRAAIDPELRAEAVAVDGFRRLAEAWRELVLV
jgi:16S rRNA (adenine1518-N6/adenine1519-N6)-dimethyltransferase